MPMVVHIVKWQILFAYNAKQAQENPVPVLLANIVVGGYRHTAFSGDGRGENNFLYLSLISLFARRRENGEGVQPGCV